MRKDIALLTMVAVCLLSPSPAVAARVGSVDLDTEQKKLVDRLVLDRAATLAAERKRADGRERILLAQLDERDKQLRRSLAQKRQSEAEAAETRAELQQVTAEREQLVADIESRDIAFRNELARFRRIIASFAASPSAERREALNRYADGDRIGAFPVLEELTRADEAARREAIALKAAEEFQMLAALAMDMKGRKEKSYDDVRRHLREAIERDPNDFWTWLSLSVVSLDARVADAGESAAEALRLAPDDTSRSVAQRLVAQAKLAAGDYSGALALFEDCLEIARRLVLASPDEVAYSYSLSLNLAQLGSAQMAAGYFADALTSYEESVRVARRIWSSKPSEGAAILLANGLGGLGQLQLRLRSLSAARASLTESVQILEKLSMSSERRVLSYAALAVAYQWLGKLDEETGNFPGALENYREMLRLSRLLVELDPEDRAEQRGLAISLARIGRVKHRSRDIEGGIIDIEESIKISRKLISLYPESAEFGSTLAFCLEQLAMLQVDSGNVRMAIITFAEALRLIESLAAKNPHTYEPRYLALGTLANLAAAQLSLGDLTGALQNYHKCLDGYRALAEKFPGRLEPRRLIVRAMMDIAAVQVEQGRLPAAYVTILNAVSSARDMVDEQPSMAEIQMLLHFALNDEATVETKLRSYVQALLSLEEATEIARRVASRSPSTESQQHLAASLDRLGKHQFAMGDKQGSLRTISDAFEIHKRIAEEDPKSAAAQRAAVRSLSRLIAIPEAGVTKKTIVEYLEELDAKGTLAPENRMMLRRARELASEK